MRTATGIGGLRELVGLELEPTAWLAVDQGRIDAFADATEDRQPIHVDPVRAAEGPFGTTVAHGFLTLSLVVHFWKESLRIEGFGVTVNYGLNRVRFPAPVPSGSRIRGRLRLDDVAELDGGAQVTVTTTVEREGGERPVCVAESVYRLLR